MSKVWSALRVGPLPVKRPLIQPNTASATPVTPTDQSKALCALGSNM